MGATKVTDLKNQERTQRTSRRRAPVLWPVAIVIAAWTIALLAILTRQTYLVDHHYLLEESHLPLVAALFLFLACWQVMTIAMMLPSSIPMVYMMVHASRKQKHPTTVQVAFLAGYAVVWTAFALAAFLADTQIHWLVDHWFWLATHSWVIGATTCGGRYLSVHAAQGTLFEAVSQPLRFLCTLLSRGKRSGLAAGLTSWNVLPGLLLGADACHIRRWGWQPGVDGRTDWGHGGGEDDTRRSASEPCHRHHLA